MRALRIVSGIAVLLTAIHFIHAIHHFMFFHAGHSAGAWAAALAAVLIDLFAFIGGVLLLKSAA